MKTKYILWSELNSEYENPELFEKLWNTDLKDVPFNYALSSVELDRIILITTTLEDLEKSGLTDLAKESQGAFPDNCFLPYSPEDREDPEKNGLTLPINYYTWSNRLYLSVTRDGYEIMTGDRCFPIKHPYIPKNEWVKSLGIFNSFVDPKSKKVCLKNFIWLPDGFIKKALGHELKYGDKSEIWKPFELKDLDIWGDKNKKS